MNKNAKIYVAGHRGMVGSAIVRQLRATGYENLILRTSKELDLRDQQAVADFFAQEQPEYVFLAAAKVGGIIANSTYPADFIYDNLMIQTNVIHQSYLNGVKAAALPGQHLHLPQAGAAADQGRVSADRPAGADQRRLRRRQDRRHHHVPVL